MRNEKDHGQHTKGAASAATTTKEEYQRARDTYTKQHHIKISLLMVHWGHALNNTIC